VTDDSITDDDRDRIRQFLAKPAYDRDVDDLVPDDAEDEE
jgi:hypothetical protein